MSKKILVSLSLLMLSASSFAIENQNGGMVNIQQDRMQRPMQTQEKKQMGMQQGQEHRRPPKEAVEACVGKASGSACDFQGLKGHHVQGSCFAPEQSKPLACKPANPPHEHQMGQQGQQNQKLMQPK